MNLTHLLSHIGLGDGEGNTSSQRVFSAAILGCLLLSKLWLSLHNNEPLVFSDSDQSIILYVLGAGVAKNVAENLKLTPKPEIKP